MANLTSKELTGLEDQLKQEENLTKKYRMYAYHCTDSQLKAKCEQMSSVHQNHYNSLLNLLG
ncbi:MAG: spore coat protein [Oscillospiraceae bacterium]|jgi:N-acetyl-anhydromuramyl-L-alanine amidase AmpD|nr:spore coat protein [Oscillospiraceae bacterium]